MDSLMYLLLVVIVVVWVLVLWRACSDEDRYDVSGNGEEID